MSHEVPHSSEDLFSPKPDTVPFLAAQSERLLNKYDIEGNPLVGTLGETLDDTGVDVFIHAHDVDLSHDNETLSRAALFAVREGFLNARKSGDFYDPLDGDDAISTYFDESTDSRVQKNRLYGLVDEYYKYLGEKSGPKPQKRIGRHALVAVKEHGRRARRDDDGVIVAETELQQR